LLQKNSNNKNVISKPSFDPKKKDIENKEIAEVMKKLEAKKKNPVPVINKEIVKKAVSPIKNYNQQINLKNNEVETSALKELMKKARADMKNKPNDEVIWMGKEKEPLKKKEDQIKIPKVIIVEKLKDNSSGKSNDEISNQPVLEMDKKKEEDLFNLNRMLNELAKIENEEETNESEISESSNNMEYKEDEARDFNVVDSDNNEVANRAKKYMDEEEINTDNTQIEELRIELENSLGFELFKNVYKIVEQKVNFKFNK
jgi:hypothetical protein